MLKLERLGNSEKIQIRVKERRSFFDRRLRQAFTYSLLFHVVVFGVFRVKFLQVHEGATVFRPVEVAIDPETPEETNIGTIAEVQEEVERVAPFDAAAQFPAAVYPHQEAVFALDLLQKPASSVTLQDDDDALETLAKEPFRFSEHLYPLSIKLSKDLSHLKLVEDGASLFKIKTSKFQTSHFSLSTTTFPISYTVKISGITGKVLQWDRTKELIDKKLQNSADLLLQKITFTPFPEKFIKGKIQIVFTCNGDEVRSMMQ